MINIINVDEKTVSFRGTTIGIVGLGLMGGSIAKSLVSIPTKAVYGLDTNEQTIKKALTDGVIDKAFTNPKELLAVSDLVIVCLYPHATIEFIDRYLDYFKADALVTDISGVKTLITESVSKRIRSRVRFIPAHPMAGRERMGYDESVDDLFLNCHYIITPFEDSTKADIHTIGALGKKLGAKNVVLCNSKTHDEYIAFTSQLPHVLAVSYIKSARERVLNNFAGGSFRDVSRVALINEVIWTELFCQNKDKLVPEIDDLIKELGIMRDLILADDKKALQQYMILARKIKEDYDSGLHDR